METPDTSPPPPRRILIVDDHPIVIRGLRMLIADEPDLEVCGEAEDVAEAIRQVQAVRPDVVVVDLTLKSGHGLDLIQRIKAFDEQIRIVVSSMHDELLFAERTLQAGARGYVMKQEVDEAIVKAIRCILAGETYVSEVIGRGILRSLTDILSHSEAPNVRLLSDREFQVFCLIGRGMKTRDIAERLDVSPKTIDTYRTRIKAKLGVASSSEVTRFAIEWQLQNKGRRA